MKCTSWAEKTKPDSFTSIKFENKTIFIDANVDAIKFVEIEKLSIISLPELLQ